MTKWARTGGLDKIAPKNPDVGLIPTPEEAANGWTAESLTKYVRERNVAQANAVLFKEKAKPPVANGRYSPLKWRSPR